MRATTRVAKAKPASPRNGQRKTMAALAAANHQAYFGPIFFMQHLRGLVRDRCPEPAGNVPSVQMHLMDGEVLDVCHIIGIAPGWIAFAVHEHEGAERPMEMRTELVPYPMIGRITIEATGHEGTHPIGFNAGTEPAVYENHGAPVMTPEEALRAVAGVPVRAEVPPPQRRRPAGSPTGGTRRPR